MKILYLTFYFAPDIGPGAFRNTATVDELARQLPQNSHIQVVTTKPNRYESFKPAISDYERRSNGDCLITTERIRIPRHGNGQLSQIWSFMVYGWAAYRLTKNHRYELVVASSSRLATAFLGAFIARKYQTPLFLDIRDLFREVMLEKLRNSGVRALLNPVLRAVERYTFGYASHINLVSEAFRSYFKSYPLATFSYLTNGIDDVFLSIPPSQPYPGSSIRTLLYAGNIGEGQALHKVIPQAARLLGATYRFVVFGGGGAARRKLEKAIQLEKVTNVDLYDPVTQSELLVEYQKADYLFVHLDDLEAFKRVLPSKFFELGATDKPIVAGVAGYAASFVQEQLENSILFNPGDVVDLVRQLRETPYRTQGRAGFRARFQRRAISQQLARQMLETLTKSSRKQLVKTL
ncbi:glycosyltransferase family 4 protein [Spirosoma jeollabukense]